MSITVIVSIICYCIGYSGDKKLLINEICSNNVTALTEKNGNICDYVELYNDGWLPHFILGVYLSDDINDLKKYEIPLNILYPQEYQLILLDEDVPFHISKEGEILYLSNEDGKILDQVECIALEKDQSYSRISDGSFTFETRTCTPGISNLKSKPVVSPPVFSHESGFYSESFELTLSTEEGRSIFYTLDGSVPTKDSKLYDGAISITDATNKENIWSMRKDVSTGFLVEKESGYQTPDYLIDKCTVIRAISIDEEGNESLAASGTYFVDFQNKEGYQGLNIVSLITDSENLFDHDDGIYVTGKIYEDIKDVAKTFWYGDRWFWWDANYTQSGDEWEREVCLQFFDKNGDLFLTKNAGVRIQGGAGRGRLPKSLNLYARDIYDGSSRFEADFWGTAYQPQRITLFAGGDDNLVKLKDYLAARASENRCFSTMDFEPYVLFLNGEYWGVYWLTEKYDKEYFEYHFHIDGDNLLMMKHGRWGFGDVSKEDEALYNEMRSAIIGNDLSVEENYQKVCEIIDVDSFIDYYATEIYIARTGDWPNSNYALWRTREVEDGDYSDGKWRWILFDVNGYSMEQQLAESDTYQIVMESDPLFASLMKNSECHDKFAAAILDRTENEFSPEKIDDFLEDFEEFMEEPLKKEYERFYGRNNQKHVDFVREIEEVEAFFKERAEYIRNYFQYDGGKDNE